MSPTKWLKTSAINCSGMNGTTLKFRRWLGVERSVYDHVYLQVSNNGSSWTTVWQNPDSTISETSWSFQSYDISSVADWQSSVYVRWGMGTTDSSVTYCGWNLDDIEIHATK